MNGLYHRRIAIMIPSIVPSEKLISVSYVVIHMWCHRLFCLARLIIVFIICIGEEVINVLINFKFAAYCQINVKKIKRDSWVVMINSLFLFNFFKYVWYSLDFMIKHLPYFLMVFIKFFAHSVMDWCRWVGEVNIYYFFYSSWSFW